MAVVLGGALLAEAAAAQSTQQRAALAESLFQEAKVLMDAGRHAEACPKLAESHRLDPGGGTVLNLAQCYETLGKTASAWTAYREALALADADGRKNRAELARQRITAIKPLVPKLLIEVDGKNLELEMRVDLDGVSVGRPAWGSEVAVDPGTHEVRASAPGYDGWVRRVEAKASARLVVRVPALRRTAEAASPPPKRPPSAAAPDRARDRSPAEREPDDTARDGRAVAAWIVGGIGLASLGVGAYLGVRALELRADSDEECPGERCTQRGKSLNDSALRHANGSNVAIGVGVVGVAVGAYLLATSVGGNRSRVSRPRIAIGPNSAALAYSGRF